MVGDIPGFVKDQEYDLTIEQLDKLSTEYDVMIRMVNVSPDRKKTTTQVFRKYFFLDHLRGMFRQR